MERLLELEYEIKKRSIRFKENNELTTEDYIIINEYKYLKYLDDIYNYSELKKNLI